MAKNNPQNPKDDSGNDKVQCQLCKGYWHRLDVHLEQTHKMTVGAYQKKFPQAPTMSAFAEDLIRQKAEREKAEAEAAAAAGEDLTKPLILGAARVPIRQELTEEEETYIPIHDENWHAGDVVMRHLEDLGLAIEEGENVLLVGPTGCGKSTLVQELAIMARQPVVRINLHGDMRVADFVGEQTVAIDEATGQSVVRWRDGVLPKAMRMGAWLLADELDAAPPQVLFVLQRVLEAGDKRLVLTANHGEMVIPHKDFRFIGTANTLGRGDESGLYAGTNVLNEAFLSRFGTIIEANYPEPTAESEILVAKSNIPKPLADKMVKLANEVRADAKSDKNNVTLSTRTLILWARKAVRVKDPRGQHDMKRTADLTFLNRMTKQDREYMGNLVQRHFGGSTV